MGDTRGVAWVARYLARPTDVRYRRQRPHSRHWSSRAAGRFDRFAHGHSKAPASAKPRRSRAPKPLQPGQANTHCGDEAYSVQRFTFACSTCRYLPARTCCARFSTCLREPREPPALGESSTLRGAATPPRANSRACARTLRRTEQSHAGAGRERTRHVCARARAARTTSAKIEPPTASIVSPTCTEKHLQALRLAVAEHRSLSNLAKQENIVGMRRAVCGAALLPAALAATCLPGPAALASVSAYVNTASRPSENLRRFVEPRRRPRKLPSPRPNFAPQTGEPCTARLS
jgi:hypothetical protein